MLAALAVPDAVASARAAAVAAAPRAPRPRAPADRRPRPSKREPLPAPLPTRQSARRRGLAPDGNGGGALPDDEGGERAGREELVTIEAYWAERGGNPVADPIVSDGCFRG